MGTRIQTIILHLELKPSEFQSTHEYFLWQRRQLKIIEAGLLQHPSIPLDRSNAFAMSLRDIIQSSESKVIDNGKSSETMKNLCNAVLALAWRSPNGTPTDSFHWADGFRSTSTSTSYSSNQSSTPMIKPESSMRSMSSQS
ncbi:hypothetical protein AAC387_Pa12g1744 [Persea americana]